MRRIWKRKLLNCLRDILRLTKTVQLAYMQIGTTKKMENLTVKVVMADTIVLAIEMAASTGEVNL